MQGLGNRTKFTLAVVTGIGTGVGLALLTCRSVWKLSRYFRTSQKVLWNKKVRVARNESQCVSLVNDLKKDIEMSKVLGFDCEWVQMDTKRKPVALLQLATGEGQCGLFQIHFYSSVPKNLKDLLEDKSILKVGIDPINDAKFLLEDYGLQVTGTVDIRFLVDQQRGENVGGLAAVVSSELGVELEKNLSIRVSNWEAEELTPEQEGYAANDALSSLLVFNKLVQVKAKIPFFCSKEDQWKQIHDYCQSLIDVTFKDKKRKVPFLASPTKKNPSHVLEREKTGFLNASPPVTQNKKSYRAFCPRKTPLYENAFMLAPNGDILCTCDTKKAEWYVSKGLAIVEETEPYKIRLLFEPSGRVKGRSAEYYTVEKENQCVTCGRKDSYLRKKIVPHEYRKFFPDNMKNHQSHDVLLLCAPCHAQSNLSDFRLRCELSTLCNAPIAANDNSRVVEDNKNKMIRSAARALLNKSHALPEARRKELLDFIEMNCSCPVTEELLQHLKDMDISVVNEEYTPHGLLVVKYFARDGIRGLMKLEKIWREHFLNVMKPQYLPPLWSVDHLHENEQDFSLDEKFLNRLQSFQTTSGL